MAHRIKVALLYGGKSSEHEISLISAASVLKHLNPEKYEVIPIGIDKAGCAYVNQFDELRQDSAHGLPIQGAQTQAITSLLQDGRFVMDVDVVFPMVHGPLYEDGCLQGLLSLANVAYVGCDVLSSAIGMDKDMARRVVCDETIQAARYRVCSAFTAGAELDDFCESVVHELGWPLFVKPCSLGSSVGIHKVMDMTALQLAIADAGRYDHTVLVEAYIQGREIELAVLENTAMLQKPRVTVPGEIAVKHQDGFYSYTAKYLESEYTDLIVPAKLDDALLHRLQTTAQEIFLRLKCRGLARIDFFVDEATASIYFNEINTLPGFTSISMYPRLWQASGLEYKELLDTLITLAINHHQRKQQLVTHYL